MKAVLSADSRPNCLVIDEIDGAPTVSRQKSWISEAKSKSFPLLQAAINILVELAKKKEQGRSGVRSLKWVVACLSGWWSA